LEGWSLKRITEAETMKKLFVTLVHYILALFFVILGFLRNFKEVCRILEIASGGPSQKYAKYCSVVLLQIDSVGLAALPLWVASSLEELGPGADQVFADVELFLGFCRADNDFDGCREAVAA
jgi:hypothetical protein